MIKNKLKEIRMREYQMNLSEFAKLLKVKLSTYSQWESGVNNPTLQKAIDIAQLLNKRIEEIWYKD